MRYFAVTSGADYPEPLRIIAEFIGGYNSKTGDCTSPNGDAMNWNPKACRAEAELLQTEEGREMLANWRASDDEVHLLVEREASRNADLEDRQDKAGKAARPDLYARFRELFEAGKEREASRVLDQLRAIGEQLVDA